MPCASRSPTAASSASSRGTSTGHLPSDERGAFLREAARVADELVVVDTALRPGVEGKGWEERSLADGSRHRIFKRYLGPERLADELGGEVLLAGRWFVGVIAGRRGRVGER